jgi:flagellar basal-body rod modification protein FlgD
MIDPVSTSSSGLAGALKEDNSLGKEAFLKLLVAELQHQDPLKPKENAEFVAELAQFSNLEQVIGINDRLDMLSVQNQGLANTEVVSLVGTKVTVKGATVTLDGGGGAVPIAFTMDSASDTTTVSILNASGDVVRTLDLGPKASGTVKVSWDGKDKNGLYMPAGPYSVAVDAKTSGGVPVSVLQQSSGRVSAVSFDKGYPLLHLDSGLTSPVSDLLRVEPSQSTP